LVGLLALAQPSESTRASSARLGVGDRGPRSIRHLPFFGELPSILVIASRCTVFRGPASRFTLLTFFNDALGSEFPSRRATLARALKKALEVIRVASLASRIWAASP